VLWPEDSFFLRGGEEPGLLVRLATLARETGAWVGAAYGSRVAGDEGKYRNRFVLVAPSGEVAWQYAKSHPVPGYEQKYMLPGDGRVARARTPWGTVAGMICFDADHLSMMRQLRGQASLLLVPSDDWPAIDALHPAMLRLRAIEQGLTIARPTINGRSRIFDARGRELAPPARLASEPWLADVPLERMRPLYLRIGDGLAWASVVGLLVLSAIAWSRRRGPRHADAG
jgi:apolipoprotein N-acyltransferase